ncbi:hypothetical protein ACRBEV_09700 [Methylobacterium phyllosphaerae]
MGIADTLAAFGDGGHKGGICAADYTIEALAETYMTWAHANEALLRTDMLAGAASPSGSAGPAGVNRARPPLALEPTQPSFRC